MRVRDRRPRGGAVVHRHLHVRVPGGGQGPGPVAEQREDLAGVVVGESGQVAVMLRCEHHHLMGAGRSRGGVGAADDGVEVRERPQAPAGTVRGAAADARDLRWGLGFVAWAKRARHGFDQSGRAATNGVGARGAAGCQQHELAGQRVVAQLRHGRSVEGVAGRRIRVTPVSGPGRGAVPWWPCRPLDS